MILGGDKRSWRLLLFPDHPNLTQVSRGDWDHSMIRSLGFAFQGIWRVPRFPLENGVTRMSQPTAGEINVSTTFNLPTYKQEAVRHILLGDYPALIEAINRMAVLGYCERIAWTDPIPTGRHGEYISVMTRKQERIAD